MVLEHFLTPYTKINLKWIKDLNVRLETIKHLEENIRMFFLDMKHNVKHNKILFNPPPRVMEIKLSKWDLIEFQSFL